MRVRRTMSSRQRYNSGQRNCCNWCCATALLPHHSSSLCTLSSIILWWQLMFNLITGQTGQTLLDQGARFPNVRPFLFSSSLWGNWRTHVVKPRAHIQKCLRFLPGGLKWRLSLADLLLCGSWCCQVFATTLCLHSDEISMKNEIQFKGRKN